MTDEIKPLTFAEAEEILEETFKGERQRIDFVTKWQTKKDPKTGEKWKDNPRMPTQTAYMATGELYDTTKYIIIRGLKLAHDSQLEAVNKILNEYTPKFNEYGHNYDTYDAKDVDNIIGQIRDALNANQAIKEGE